MLKDLLKFEWYYHTRKPLFYIALIAFAAIGFVLGSTSGITFPNVYKNSPYEISYLVGVLSLGAIFSVTLLVAQSILRDSETKFDTIIYASPVSKRSYLSARFISLGLISILVFALAIPGLYLGHLLGRFPSDKIGNYSFLNYLWPFMVLAVPNVLICTAVLCSTAWITKNKLSIYIAGLFIYILYIAGSIFSNSPLIAGSSPSTPEAMALFAKLDPFGLAAFFEQTRYWTAVERNVQQISFSGNFLFNRILWFVISMTILVLSYTRFSFRTQNVKRAKKSQATTKNLAVKRIYKPSITEIQTLKHHFTSLFSFIRIQTAIILKGIPIILIFIIWTALLGIEITNSIDGDPRLGENFASSGLMVSTILETLPFFTLLVILFYSSELIWKSRAVNFAPIENAIPVHPFIISASQFIALGLIPFLLIAYSCLIGIICQFLKGFYEIDFQLYSSLFYFLGFPLLLSTVMIIVIQSLISNKYLGLLSASILLFLSSSSLGSMLGIKHPLLRYGQPFKILYADMNGFGSYTTAFHWQTVYYIAFSICVVMLVNFARKGRIAVFRSLPWSIFTLSFLVLIFSGAYIFYQTNIKFPNPGADEINDWKQEYENKFKSFENFPQPGITSVRTKIDLFPEEQRYEVKGQYRLQNKTGKKIDSLLLYADPLTTINSMEIENARLLKGDTRYGHSWYVLNEPLLPGKSIRMNFRFSSGWSAFKGHMPFNSIIQNGTFIRITNYYPTLGYESGNEISNEMERKKRGMKPQTELAKLETPTAKPYDYRYIDLDAIVSTSSEQQAIGSGNLLKSWKSKGRNYFHYKTAEAIPFRFAFSSARYLVKKDKYRDVAIEVYYDARHAGNVEKLIADTKNTLAYCETNFGRYTHEIIRFAEISAFAEGFGATAYPATIYMKEDGGFYRNISSANNDIINMLAGHELSHQWWGSAQLSPEQKEGSWILTETLAKYTELVLFERAHGTEAALDKVRQHLDLYLSNRSFTREMPLYKTHYDTPHIPYDKGLVVMWQLKQLIGESAINKALKSFLKKHAFPMPPADSRDLILELYKFSARDKHLIIDDLFKKIVLYDSKIDSVIVRGKFKDGYLTSFHASADKYQENGLGKRSRVIPSKNIEVGVYSIDGKLTVKSFPVVHKKVAGTLWTKEKPSRIVIDPYLKAIDAFPKDNDKNIQ